MVQRTDKKKKNNNKGFSLVELIVVIAIMAVLVAVLAPQFTKYIDQSRKSNDAATVSGIVTAAQVGIADAAYEIQPDTYTITVTSSKTEVTSITSENADDMKKAIEDACGDLSGLKITSKNWKDKNNADANQVRAELVYKDGAVTITYSADFAEYVNGTASTDDNKNND